MDFLLQRQLETLRDVPAVEQVICRWDAATGELKGSQLSKARKFNHDHCIDFQGNGTFLVRPIQGYNHTTYTVLFTPDGCQCDCQYSKRYGNTCSHIMAVGLFIQNSLNKPLVEG